MIHRVNLLDLLGVELPIVQAPMAGFERQRAGGGRGRGRRLGIAAVRDADAATRSATRWPRSGPETDRPFNLNFFCHADEPPGAEAGERWFDRLAGYYEELGVARPDRAERWSRRLRRGAVRAGRGAPAARGQLPLRAARSDPLGPGPGYRGAGALLRHHRRGGTVARPAGLRRGDRPGCRGGWPSRDVPHRRTGRAGGHVRPGAPGGRRGRRTGDRGRWHRRLHAG